MTGVLRIFPRLQRFWKTMLDASEAAVAIQYDAPWRDEAMMVTPSRVVTGKSSTFVIASQRGKPAIQA